MTNETKDNGEAFILPSNKQKMHPYAQVLQWVAEGKEIECYQAFNSEWRPADYDTVLSCAIHGVKSDLYLQPQDFRLKPERHIHQDLIDAYKSGAKIQYWSKTLEDWLYTELPTFYEGNKYRIKPEPKPDVVRYIHITKERSVDIATYFPSAWVGAVLEVTLDGETGEIKHSKKYQGDFND